MTPETETLLRRLDYARTNPLALKASEKDALLAEALVGVTALQAALAAAHRARAIEDGLKMEALQELDEARASLAERTRERDEARVVIAEPTEAEIQAYRASLTPQDERRHEAIRKLVVDPDILDRLRAALSASQAEVETEKRMHAATTEALKATMVTYEEDEREHDALVAEVASGKRLGAAVASFSEWLGVTADSLDESEPADGIASQGSIALTAALLKLAEFVTGSVDQSEPTPEAHIARCAELQAEVARLRPAAEALRDFESWLGGDTRRRAHFGKSFGMVNLTLEDANQYSYHATEQTLPAAILSALAKAQEADRG